VLKFQRRVVLPALEQFASELHRNNVTCQVIDEIAEGHRVRLEVFHGTELDFIYEVRCRHHRMPDGGFQAPNDLPDKPETPENVYYRAEVHLSEGGQDYDVMGWDQEQLVLDVLQRYENHIHFLHNVY